MAHPDSRAGSSYALVEILHFVANTHAPHDDGLDRAFRADETDGLPPIQVGASEGKALGLLLRLIGARKVVEVGTLAGYSAIWMARALAPGGKLWSLDNDPAHVAVARANLEAADLSDQVEVVLGDALESLASIEKHGPFCAVFIDADKEHYPDYGAWAAANLRPGGLLLGDNAFFFGNLLDDSDAARAMRRFHEEAAKVFDSVCLPTSEGLLVGVRR